MLLVLFHEVALTQTLSPNSLYPAGSGNKSESSKSSILPLINLTFGLSKTPNSSSPPKPPKTNLSQPEAARIQDLLPLAIQSLQEILGDSDIRVADRLKAIQIVFSCGGVDELQALAVLISSGWLPPEMLSPAGKAVGELKQSIRNLLRPSQPDSIACQPGAKAIN